MTVITPVLNELLDPSSKYNSSTYKGLFIILTSALVNELKASSTIDGEYIGEVTKEVANKTTSSCPTEKVPTSSISSLVDESNIGVMIEAQRQHEIQLRL